MSRAASGHLAPRLPPHAPGMSIGLYGGSFNPPHAAHRMVARAALTRLGLDRLWLLVSPGNPLKDNAELPSVDARMAAAKALLDHPRIVVSDLEAELGAARTYDVAVHLRRRCPGVRFVWIMGADNLATFHRWGRWREIAALMPIAVVDRPGATLSPLSSPAGRALGAARLAESDAALLPFAQPPAWCFLHVPRSPLSSTALRGPKTSS